MEHTYDLKLIYDYIWGNDIDEHNIDELENNPDFMIQVLEKSKDKRMYELCSDTVKSNYSFVRSIINLFPTDLEFISEVAEFYLDSLSDAEKEQGTSYAELNIVMSELYGKNINEFAIRALAFYETERARVQACLSVSDNEFVKSESKSGFMFTAAEYEDSTIIVDFVAKRMVNSALYGEEYNNLEYLIHKRFKSIEELEAYGKVNFLQDCINEFDQYLGLYVSDASRPETFEMFFGQASKDIETIIHKWPIYMDKLNSWRIGIFEREINEYMLDNNAFLGRLSYDDIALYVARKFAIEDVFRKYDPNLVDTYDADKYKILEVSDVNCINKAMNLAKQLFSTDVIDYSYDDYIDDVDADIKKVFPKPVNDDSTGIIRFKLTEAGTKISK